MHLIFKIEHTAGPSGISRGWKVFVSQTFGKYLRLIEVWENSCDFRLPQNLVWKTEKLWQWISEKMLRPSQSQTRTLVKLVGNGNVVRRCLSSLVGSNDYFDVLVVGGGIMGSSTAHWLTSRNPKLKVGVVECDPTYNTSATTLSVGGLRQQFSLPGTDLDQF